MTTIESLTAAYLAALNSTENAELREGQTDEDASLEELLLMLAWTAKIAVTAGKVFPQVDLSTQVTRDSLMRLLIQGAKEAGITKEQLQEMFLKGRGGS